MEGAALDLHCRRAHCGVLVSRARSSNSSSAAGQAMPPAIPGRGIISSAPVIRIEKDRAMAETSVVIRVRQKFGGVDVDLTSCSRFLDRVERHGSAWLIAERAAIYERDRLDPVEPSAEFDALFEEEHLALPGTIPLHGVPDRACRRPGAGAAGVSRRRPRDGRSLCTLFRLARRRRGLTRTHGPG